MLVTVYSDDNTIEWGASGVERIVQNVRNIIRIRPLEVPFMPLLGINEEFTDAIPDKIKSDFATHVAEVINEYEPRVDVVDVRILSVDENGDYVFAVDLEV